MKIGVYPAYVLFVLLVCIPHPECDGQVNDSLKYKVSFQIGGQRKTGVFSQTSLRVAAKNKLERRKLIFQNVSGYTYTNVNSLRIASDWDFRSILLFKADSSARLLPAIAHNFHSNILYRIGNSNRGIVGFRTIPFRKIPNLSFLLGGGYEHSNYAGEIFVNSPYVSSTRSFAVGFANISGKHRLGKGKVILDYNLSFVQSIREVKDQFLWFTTGIGLPIHRSLSIGVDYDIRYRNVHLQEIPQVNDLLLINFKVNASN